MVTAAVAEHDVGWLAKRQPAVVRLLGASSPLPMERRSRRAWTWRAASSADRRGIGRLGLDHNALNSGLAAVRSGRCDRAMVRSLRDQIEELPRAILTPFEQDAVATTIAAVLWAILDVSMRDEAAEAAASLPPRRGSR